MTSENSIGIMHNSELSLESEFRRKFLGSSSWSGGKQQSGPQLGTLAETFQVETCLQKESIKQVGPRIISWDIHMKSFAQFGRNVIGREM